MQIIGLIATLMVVIGLIVWQADLQKQVTQYFGADEKSTPLHIPDTRYTTYKWQGEDQVWHYGDSPPHDAQSVTEITVEPNKNVIEPIPLPAKSQTGAKSSQQGKKPPPQTPGLDEQIKRQLKAIHRDREKSLQQQTR